MPCRVKYPCVRYLKKLYRRHGIKKDFDVVALHPYSPNVALALQQLKQGRKVMRRNGDDKTKIWVSELGWGSKPPDGRFNKGKAGQAQILTKAFRALYQHRHALGISLVSWFSWRDWPTPQRNCTWCTNAGLLGTSGKAKPSWAAFRRFAKG
jgi:hypothetical protein